MKTILKFGLLFLTGCGTNLVGCSSKQSAAAEVTPQMIQPVEGYKYNCAAGAENCKTVFIVGDSISIGYTPFLAKNMTDKNVYHPLENCRNSWFTLKHVDRWISEVPTPETIIWNNGIWNVVRDVLAHQAGNFPEEYGTTLEQYESDMRQIAVKLKATGARVIFMTTTELNPAMTDNYFDNNKIHDLNLIAKRIMPELGVELYDLNALTMVDHLFDGIHNDEYANGIIGKAIADKIGEK